jgi:hypothetical protein
LPSLRKELVYRRWKPLSSRPVRTSSEPGY